MFSTLGCHKLRSDLEALKGSQYVSVASYAIGNVSEAPIMTPLPLSSKLVVLVVITVNNNYDLKAVSLENLMKLSKSHPTSKSSHLASTANLRVAPPPPLPLV